MAANADSMNSVLAMTQSANPFMFSNANTGNVLALLNTLYTSGFASHSPSHPLLADSMNSVLAMTQSANPFMFSNANTGNVLALLNTLYTSGFASHSPSHPLLAGRTMHTLYAISFIVYSLTNICDWIFVYFTLRGYVTSFPLKTWLVVTLVAIAVAGSMLTSLLLVLCVENAFAHRLDITPYRSGLMVIIEALIQWIQAFNNFRIAFLFMVLHDIPLTVLNFVFITACRCNGPQVRHWPLIMTTITTLVSILWRMVMLYFAYRRMICPLRKSSSAISLAKYPSAIEHLRANLSQKDGGRLDEYDECWPIRFSVKKVYGTNASNDAHRQNNHSHVRHWPLIMTTITTLVSILWRMVMLYFAYRRMICPLRKSSSAISLAKYPSAIEHLRANLSQKDGGRLDEYDECWPIRFSVKKVYGTNASNDAHRQNNHSHVSVIIRSRSFIISILDALLYKVIKLFSSIFRLTVCVLLALLIYVVSILTLCAPCCYHYGCRTNSFYHRHKWARSFVRYFSQSFHYTMFFMSFITIIVLLCLNMTLLTSVHAIGSNQFPFEISHVCVEVDLTKREITARVDSDNREHKSNATMKFVCKPFWEDGGFGVGLNRQEAGPWQTRIKISARKLLAISTQVHMNYTDRHNPHHTLLYDYAILQRFGGIRAQYDCFKGRSSEWVFKTSVDTLKWPYYIACDRSWSMQAEHLIECENRDEDTLFF
ncbi:hypothetical protein Tcan_18136 [Toxocara canis]|uniref:Transmembrane protein n=1 Tax=Toxocara canis TaxID=6265 RepID=A0A0B2VJE6_TOXCA|nr:hypothetical protein Tcan_18136 [Toxocara canis]